MNDAERGIAVIDGVGDDSQCQQVIHLIDVDLLPLQLLIDGVHALDARIDARLNIVFLQLGADRSFHLGQQPFAVLALGLDQLVNLFVADRIDVGERQILELAAHLAHAETMRQRGINLQRLFGDLHLPLGRERLQRPHVMQAVGQLDQHHADVVDHRQHHFADVFRLRLLARGKVDAIDLGDAFDDVRHLLAKFFSDLLGGYRGVFHRVVQQTGGDGGSIQPHFRQDDGNFQGVNQVGLAGLARLAAVIFQRELVGAAYHVQIVVRTVLPGDSEQVSKPGHRQNIRRDLLPQRRHN